MKPNRTDVNPYLSPQVPSVAPTRSYDPQRSPRCYLQAKGLLYRRIQLDSPLVACIEYNARSLTDRILVDGRVAVRKWPILWLSSSLPFVIPTDQGDLAAEITVTVGRWLRIQSFSLRIDHQLLYQEGAADQVLSMGRAV